MGTFAGVGVTQQQEMARGPRLRFVGMSWKRWLRRGSVRGAAAGSVALLALAGCSAKPSATGPAAAGAAMGPMPVAVVRVDRADVPLTGDWVGTMDGYVNAQIQPQVSGYLVRQLYKEGSAVGKGQVLFQIDPRPLQAAVDQAQGQVQQAQGAVAQAQAQQGLAQINVNRDAPLAEARAIAQSQLDNDKQAVLQQGAAVRSAQAQVSSAQAALATAKLNLGFTQVRSLISGVAGQATTQVGNLVSPQSVLTSVSQLDPIKVFFSISDGEYLQLTTRAKQSGGGDLLHSGRAVPLTLTLSNGQVYGPKGQIVFVDRGINQQTGAIRIAAAFPNPGNVLRPGQFARITAQTQVRRGVVLAPQLAVTELQGTEQVYTVGADNKVHVVNVTLGPQIGPNWIVNSGLPPGTQVIVNNLQKLKEGVPVAPQAAPAVTEPTTTNSQTAGR